MSIKLEHINYVYSEGTAYEKHALKDVSLEIPHGEFVGIIGHTGSGKSTLIQHLNGLIKATSGALYYNGENIYGENYNLRELRNQVGLVFQYPEHQLFEVNVLQDVCFGPKNQGLSRKNVKSGQERRCSLLVSKKNISIIPRLICQAGRKDVQRSQVYWQCVRSYWFWMNRLQDWIRREEMRSWIRLPICTKKQT